MVALVHATIETMSSAIEASDQVHYSEKLWPAWWIWVALTVVGASFSTIFFPMSVTVGLISMAVGVALCLFALVITTPKIEVTSDWLKVGRARIERQYLGHIVAHRGDAAREQLGPGFDARSYQCIRGSINPVITAEVTDPQDATPYWIFSTRSPEKLLKALGSQAEVRHTGVSVV